MTKENALRAYKYALEIGNTKRAENILIRYPEFKEEKPATEKDLPEEPKVTKSKGKK